MTVYDSHSERETEQIGERIARECKEGDFLALYGDMGSGKTVFMRGFVGYLVPQARVSSPTYAVLNVYEGEDICVNHFDMYRISSEDDLYSTGYEEVITRGITVCEWSENIKDILKDDCIQINITLIDDDKRKIEIIR